MTTSQVWTIKDRLNLLIAIPLLGLLLAAFWLVWHWRRLTAEERMI